MEYTHHAEQFNGDTRAFRLFDFRAQINKQRFDIAPLHVSTYGPGEDQFKRRSVFAFHDKHGSK